MSVSIKPAVLATLSKVLDPLVRLLIDAGIGPGEFHQLVKRSYVKAATAVVGEQNISGIRAMTGMNRADIARILKTPTAASASVKLGTSAAEKVLRGWWSDETFHESSYQPALLPLKGSRKSFAALVERYAGSARPGGILKELLRVKAVRQLPDKRVEALTRSIVTVSWDERQIAALGDYVGGLIATLGHNLKHPTRPTYARFVTNPALDPKFLPLLLRDITQHSDVEADTWEEAINSPNRTIRPGGSAQNAHRLTVGIFVVEAPTTVPPRPAPLARSRSRTASPRRG